MSLSRSIAAALIGPLGVLPALAVGGAFVLLVGLQHEDVEFQVLFAALIGTPTTYGGMVVVGLPLHFMLGQLGRRQLRYYLLATLSLVAALAIPLVTTPSGDMVSTGVFVATVAWCTVWVVALTWRIGSQESPADRRADQ